MMPPLLRRCPQCGHVSLGRRFAVVGDADVDGSQLVECPSCGHRFATADSPWLA